MIRLASSLALAAAGLSGATAAGVSESGGLAMDAAARRAGPQARLPGFAAELAERPLATGADAWPRMTDADAWEALAIAAPDMRQARRWEHAVSLIAQRRGAEAIGVLDVMGSDDADLALVAAWRRARGVALAQARQPDAALAALADPALAGDSESCLWRMHALAAGDQPRHALAELRCAMPALLARPSRDRHRFVIDVGAAAVAIGRHRPALAWLATLADGDPAANLLRGKSYLALGEGPVGRLRLERVKLSGNEAQRAEAQLDLIEAEVAGDKPPAPATIKRLDRLLFTWRGDAVERRALELSLRLAERTQDTPRYLIAGAALFRYVDLGRETAPLAAGLQARLAAALSAESTMPLGQAAGLFWDYRDLAPVGPDGDRLAESLVGRLTGAGLYARAADLLQFRMAARALDIEQGPLSVRIATLRILAGTPKDAARVIRSTDATPYPSAMQADRRRIEAVALDLLGRPAEALAALADIPDSDGLVAEIYWRARDWANLVQVGEPSLPRPDRLSEVGQAIVLRHAIALAMLGREDALARLRQRYEAGFARLPTAGAFALLTAQVGTVDPATMGKAMAALPTASPAGEIGDLIERGSEAMKGA